MGGKSSKSGNTRVYFAPYVEAAHKDFINDDGNDKLSQSVFYAMNALFNQSPYDDFETISAEDGFLAGSAITTVPSLFSILQSFTVNQDLTALWNKIYNELASGTEIDDAVQAQSAILQDELETTAYPKLLAGYRDINAVMSTAFIAAKAILQDGKTKALNDYAAKLKLQQQTLVHSRWADELNWNKAVASMYGDAMKLYYSARFDAEAREMEFAVKDKLWNLSLFDYGRAAVAALNGAAAGKSNAEPSQAAKSISMTASGAGAGAMLGQSIGGAGSNYASYGAAAGGLLGLAASFA